LFGAKGAITIGRCRESGDHLWEDLGKSGYKLDMKSCLKSSFYIFGYTVKTNIEICQFMLFVCSMSMPPM
jgi:hypothetical protein